MLPEYRQDMYENWGQDMPFFGSVLDGTTVNAPELNKRARLVEQGMPALGIIALDRPLRRLLDGLPVNDAVFEIIPAVEAAISDGNANLMRDCVSHMNSLYFETPSIHASAFETLMDHHFSAKKRSRERTLEDMEIPYISRGKSPLSVTDMPSDLRLIKMFAPSLLLNSWQLTGEFDMLQAKLLRTPFVTSAYAGADSMSFHGVGVCVFPKTILRSYVTDADSGETTQRFSPDLDEVDRRVVQAISWNDIKRLSFIRNAHTLNISGFWYPEIVVEVDSLRSVVVRPYDAWVAGSKQCHTDFFGDTGRYLAAVMLSRSLGGVPIEVLE